MTLPIIILITSIRSLFRYFTSLFFHKVSSKLFNGLAKLNLSFWNSSVGEVVEPQVSLVTKHLNVHDDVVERNVLFNGFFDVGPNLKINAAHDLKVGLFTRNFSAQYYLKEENVEVNGSVHVGLGLQLRAAHNSKAQQGEVTLVANLSDPGYQVELASPVPSIGLPRATLKFPCGEVSVEVKEDEEVKRILSVNGVVKGSILNGFCTALYQDENLNLRYSYKRRYGCRAMMLKTVAAMPGMVGVMLLHIKSLCRFEQSGGWIKALVEEAENERMHLMTMVELVKPK